MATNHWPDPITARKEIEALASQNCGDQEPGGGLPFNLDDHLTQVRLCVKHGLGLDEWRKTSGVSPEYAQALKDYLTQFSGEG